MSRSSPMIAYLSRSLMNSSECKHHRVMKAIKIEKFPSVNHCNTNQMKGTTDISNIEIIKMDRHVVTHKQFVNFDGSIQFTVGKTQIIFFKDKVFFNAL